MINKIENKAEYFSEILKKNTLIIGVENMQLGADETVSVEFQGVDGLEQEDIVFLHDFSEKMVVIDGFFKEIFCALDTTNIEKIGIAIAKKLKIDDVEKWEFIFITKDNSYMFEPISVRIFDKDFKLKNCQQNYKLINEE